VRLSANDASRGETPDAGREAPLPVRRATAAGRFALAYRERRFGKQRHEKTQGLRHRCGVFRVSNIVLMMDSAVRFCARGARLEIRPMPLSRKGQRGSACHFVVKACPTHRSCRFSNARPGIVTLGSRQRYSSSALWAVIVGRVFRFLSLHRPPSEENEIP